MSIQAPPPQSVTTTTTTAQANTQARAGASGDSPSCLGGSSHGVGPGQNPQYTRAHFGGKAVGCSLALQHTTMSPRKRNTITTWMRSKCYAIARNAEQCVSMECADVPDVSNALRDDLSNVVSRAETLRQCKLGFSTDKMVGDNNFLTARCSGTEQPSVRTVSIALGIVAGLTTSVGSRRHQQSFI